jgi:riboflavin kinase/FMN adenylyltransferase
MTMHVARGLDELGPADHPAFVVVGVFDGLHLGHAYLLDHLATEAARRGARPIVVTFDHHPDEVITGTAPPLLCDPSGRLALLEAAGVGTTVVVHFDQALRETTYDAFVDRLSAHGKLAGFLMTPDAAFGFQRAGTPVALAELGRDRGFEVVVVPPFELDGRAVRSTEVRTAIASGDLAMAERLLGRQHTVVGAAEAVGEAGDGVALAFELPVMLPPDGTWAAVVDDGRGAVQTAVTVTGSRLFVPTVSAGRRTRVRFEAGAGTPGVAPHG